MKKKYICRIPCQARTDEGFINTYRAGDTDYFNECPPHFVPASLVKGSSVDFMIVKEGLLRDDIIPVADIISFYKKTYGVDLTGRSRKDVVDALLHSRSTSQSLISAASTAVTAHEFKNDNVELGIGAGINVDFEQGDTEPEPDKSKEVLQAMGEDSPEETDPDFAALMG